MKGRVFQTEGIAVAKSLKWIGKGLVSSRTEKEPMAGPKRNCHVPKYRLVSHGKYS